jgi:hypothetical protein
MSTVMMQRWSIPEMALAAAALLKLGVALYSVLGLFAL